MTIDNHMKKILLQCLVLITIFSSCKKGNTSISTENDENIGVTKIDSFTVRASTVMLDSIQTSGTGILLLGEVNDPEFGKTTSSTYFPLKSSAKYPVISNIARFDSLKLFLNYSGHQYGDTTTVSTIEAFQLSDKIKLLENPKVLDPDEKSLLSTTNVLYNNSKTKYYSSALGIARFKPKPHTGDSVGIKLNSVLGQELFNLIRERDPIIDNDENFGEYIKGFALVPKTENGNSIVGFKTSSLRMSLYYSEANDNGIRITKNIFFNMADSSFQYNNISTDRKNTALDGISYANREIPLSKTGNRGYIQAGAGLTTKIDLPYIINFLANNAKIINKAELVINVPKKPFTYLQQPQRLNLLIANDKNKPIDVIRNVFATGDQFAQLEELNSSVASTNRYVFNLTEYLTLLKKDPKKYPTSLLLSVPINQLNKSLEQTRTGGPGNANIDIKLNIYYTEFK